MTTTSTQQGRLQDKTAVITGATTGIGLEVARQFIVQGAAKVIVTGQNRERLDAAASALGPRAVPVLADVRRVADLDALAARAKAEVDRLDILVANAGVASFGPFEAVTEEQLDEQLSTNVKGAFFTIQKLCPLLGKGSSVILTSSSVHARAMPNLSVYAATKAALRSLARSLALELAPRGIRVNTLSPGMVVTPFFERAGIDADTVRAFEQNIGQTTPLARAALAEEIAAAAVFLASDESSYTTGADLLADGGFNA